ncbi:MAG TPA: hypothetical protein VMM76_17275 [Pirellulaceae bacterium]|nr:hypothetical protein [Pirellulaceae bacterium]
MSTRDYFFSITSIEPIRAVVGSRDETLVNALIETYASQYDPATLEDEDVQDDIEERRSWADSMINCERVPKKEPGCWNYFVEDIARHLGLEPDSNLPFNEGWKHNCSWQPYRNIVKRHVTRQSGRSLAHLEDGRPLRGKRIDYDGCLFGWLTADEVKELHQSLSQLHDALIANTDFVDFHETLVESLKIVSSDSRDLFMGAC